jgi:hypothetical protein
LDWHWFADLIAGLLVGSTVLQLTATVDAALPPTALHAGPLELLRSVRRHVMPRAPEDSRPANPDLEQHRPTASAAAPADVTAVPQARPHARSPER